MATTLEKAATGLADDAFALRCDRAARNSYALAGYLLGTAHEAEEVTQEVMTRAWKARHTLRDETALDAWLDRIVANVCKDRLRRRGRVRIVDLESGAALESDDPFRRFLARDALGSAFDALPPEQRLVVVLRFWHDLRLEQIADWLDWPLDTVKSRLHHALAALRVRLERDDSEVAQ